MKKMTIRQLHERYLKKSLTVEEVVDQALLSAEKFSDYHVWIHLLTKEEIMQYVKKLGRFSLVEKPLWGIPFAIKDNIDLRGVPTTAACPAFSYIPEKSAEVVEALIQAGAIPIGKTNLDQFATGLVGTRSPYGVTKNALNPEMISGGSSSGSAVSVALGQVCFSLGTDTAGSGRVPAALNEIIGYKAAVGRYSTVGVVPACESIDCVSLFANSMEDIRQIDHVLSKSDSAEVSGKAMPETILLPNKLTFFGPFAKDYEEAWGQMLSYLRERMNVEVFDMTDIQAVSRLLYEGPFVVEREVAIGNFAAAHEKDLEQPLMEILQEARKKNYSANCLFESLHFCKKIEKATKKSLMNRLLILPTCTGTWTIDQVLADPIATNSQMGLYTNHCNLLNLSAMALPAPVKSRLPFGITLFSLPEEERMLKNFAEEIEYDKQKVELVVCGLHMRGFPLENDLRAIGGEFCYQTKTSADYRLYELATEPCKPGLIKDKGNGEKIAVEVWRLPNNALSDFVQTIPFPLGIGKVKLENGMEELGFICQEVPKNKRKDITHYGSWKTYQSEENVKLH